MPFPLSPSPRRDTANQTAHTGDQTPVPGPSPLHSPEPGALHDSPRQNSTPSPAPAPSSATACGSRSTRPAGTR